MIENLVIMQSYGLYSGEIGSLIQKLTEAGFFTYLLPFLLIFSLVFGILSITKLFEQNKAVNGIIALVIGLMALQFELVPRFFAELFPRLGVGLGVILVVIILLGLFLPKANWVVYTLFGVAAVVLIVVLYKTASGVGWEGGYWWTNNWELVAGGVFVLIVIGTIIGASNPSKENVISPLMEKLFKS